jgi:hypothetical protein
VASPTVGRAPPKRQFITNPHSATSHKTASFMNITAVLWDEMFCSSVGTIVRVKGIIYPVRRGNRLVLNIGAYLPICTVSHAIIQPTS